MEDNPPDSKPPLPIGSVRGRSWLLAAIIIFVLSRAYILFLLKPLGSDAFNGYFPDASGVVDRHEVPYATLQIEYPPVAWWVICAPRLVSPHQLVDLNNLAEVDSVRDEYLRLFRGLMFACDLGSFVLLLWIAARHRPDLLACIALTYTFATAILAHVLYDRLDMGLLFLIMLWAFCWIKSMSETGRTMLWSAAAYAAIGLGIGYKLIPAICVPFLLLADWRGSRRTVRISVGFAALAITALGPFIVQYLISGPSVFTPFQYHGERGIEVESIYATLMFAMSNFGFPVEIVPTHHAAELIGRLSKLMTALSNVLLFGFLAGTWLWVFFRRGNYTRRDGYRWAAFTMAAAIVFSKVLSPQYFIWVLPLALLVAIDVFPTSHKSFWILAVLLVAISGLTTWIFPYNFVRMPSAPNGLLPLYVGEGISTVGACVVGLRNFVYLATMTWIGVWLVKKTGITQ